MSNLLTSSKQSETTDCLAQAVHFVRPYLAKSLPVSERLQALWAAVVAARDLGAADIIETAFLQLAHETELGSDLGRQADFDLRHVIRWAMRNQNPFQ